MSVTAVSLVARFPEFTQAYTSYPDLVTGSIADATLMVDSDQYGDKADMAITYLAAHMIATNPLGEMARIDKKGESTTYLTLFNSVKRSIGAGCRVI